MPKQLFLSHTWAYDEQGRDTHARVRELASHLQSKGWTVWFDDVDMDDNLDAAMAAGIDAAEAVIMILTRAYARKINRAANARKASNDNCLKEFTYAMFREKLIIPVVFEDSMRNPHGWSPGVVPMRLCMTLYVDGTQSHGATATDITRKLVGHGMHPLVLMRRRLMRQKSRDTRIQVLAHV